MRRVLIIAHNDELLQFCQKALQERFKIFSLSWEDNMTKLLEQTSPELILLTVSDNEAGVSGIFDNIESILKEAGKPVVTILSAHNLRIEQKMLSLGAEDIITLPVTQELLLHRVQSCLELADLRLERPYVEKYQDAISTSFAELVECRDITTGGHLKNTTRYFEILLKEAMENDLYRDVIPKEDVRDLLRSATLHDIGKLGITDDILRKEASLDYNEFEHMKTHTTLGKQAFEKIIKETGGTRWLYLAKDMAYCHHERWNGTGYPNGLKGEEIPLYARMLTVADVYDALTSNRAYKEAFSHEKAMQIIIEGKGSYFDPSIIDLFVKANKRFEALLQKSTESESR